MTIIADKTSRKTFLYSRATNQTLDDFSFPNISTMKIEHFKNGATQPLRSVVWKISHFLNLET